MNKLIGRKGEGGFYKLVNKDNKKINSYAFLGETSIRDRIKRFDILEQCVSKNSESREILFDSIMEVANNTRASLNVYGCDYNTNVGDEFANTSKSDKIFIVISYYFNPVRPCRNNILDFIRASN